jgi:two-component system, LytTR family, response regulator
MSSPLRVAIVDDEPLARQRVRDLLEQQENLTIAGEAATGDDAVQLIIDERPDLVFLDVQMPGKSGLEVAAELGPERMPATIFVTAFDRYALDAFEIAAVDYLLKPFDDERFEQALDRARKRIELADVRELADRLVSVLQRDGAPAASAPKADPEYLDRIAVDMRGQTRVIPVGKIDYITASGPYAELHIGEGVFAVRERMQSLEERLDPKRFARIHRSAIVRLDLVDTLLRASGGDYAVRLRNGVELSVSRGRREELERRLGRAVNAGSHLGRGSAAGGSR